MDLLRLRYFVALAETENLTQTANDLHISPSSLSLTITKLEKELDTQLFDRVGRKLQLNETGKELSFSLRNLLAELYLALNRAMNKNTVSVIVGLPAAWSAPLAEFSKLKPEFHISNRTIRRSALEQELLAGKYDFHLTSEPRFPDFMESQQLTSPTLCLAVPETSELAKKSSVTLAELKEENFLLPVSTFSLYETYMDICREKQFEPKIVANCNFYVRLKMVASGLGVTFVDSDTKEQDLFKRVAFLDISDAPALPTRYICWRKGRALSPAAKEFLDFIVLYYQDA